jgi:hypothetical protein
MTATELCRYGQISDDKPNYDGANDEQLMR